MTPHEQTDLFGGAVPVDELDLSGHTRALAEAEREMGGRLSADEAGALIHERRGKHPRDERCHWCSEDGTEALTRLRAKTPTPAIQTVNDCFLHGPHDSDRCPHPDHKRAELAKSAPWTCRDCEHANPPGSIYCRGCGTCNALDPEPHVGALRPQAPEVPNDPDDDAEPPVGGLLPREGAA